MRHTCKRLLRPAHCGGNGFKRLPGQSEEGLREIAMLLLGPPRASVKNPCLMALRATRALPLAVRGPVERTALCRLAFSRRSVSASGRRFEYEMEGGRLARGTAAIRDSLAESSRQRPPDQYVPMSDGWLGDEHRDGEHAELGECAKIVRRVARRHRGRCRRRRLIRSSPFPRLAAGTVAHSTRRVEVLSHGAERPNEGRSNRPDARGVCGCHRKNLGEIDRTIPLARIERRGDCKDSQWNGLFCIGGTAVCGNSGPRAGSPPESTRAIWLRGSLSARRPPDRPRRSVDRTKPNFGYRNVRDHAARG